MTLKRPLPEDLARRLKPCPVDFERVQDLIKRAQKDLKSAGVIRESDLEGAYQFLYDGMLHTALALMAGDGMRPDIRGKHKTAIDYAAEALGRRYEAKIEFYDRMRRRRHQLLYEPGPFCCSEKELEDARQALEEFIALISAQIQAKNPRKEFNFEIG